MRLRIRTLRALDNGDGRYVTDMPTGLDVIVEDADTGERLDGVQAVTWKLVGPTDPVAATVTFIGAEIDADVDARYAALERAGK